MPMLALSRETIFVAVCGILSGILAFLNSYIPDAGLVVLFLPLVPLAIAGLSLSARQGMGAALIACVVAGVMAGGEHVLFFTVLIVLPMLHFMRKVLQWRGEGEERQWYPVLPVLAEITLMTCIVLAGYILILGHSEHGALKTIMAQAMHKQLDPQMVDTHTEDASLAEREHQYIIIMKMLIDEWNFIAFACMGWLWVLLLYAFTVIANIFLEARGIALRPSLAIAPGGLPLWLPFLIAVATAAAAFGNSNDRYLGEVVILIMVLPYFISGIAKFHTKSRHWPLRWVWIILFYCIFLCVPALAVLAIARGMLTQIEEVLKSHPAAKDH